MKLYEEFMEERFSDMMKAKKEKLVKKAKQFGKALKKEGEETKTMFFKIKDSIKSGEKLSKEDRDEIKKQMGDILEKYFTAQGDEPSPEEQALMQMSQQGQAPAPQGPPNLAALLGGASA